MMSGEMWWWVGGENEWMGWDLEKIYTTYFDASARAKDANYNQNY
jgi:hypothetical protein